LPGYDYSLAGGYFVTITASERGDLFGVLQDERVVLNELGKMVQQCWEEIPNRFPTVELDEFIVMPDHLHAILFLGEPDVGAGLDPARNVKSQRSDDIRATTRVAPTLGRIIGAFKSISTIRYFSGLRKQDSAKNGNKLWQRGYYDRIVRNEDELNSIRNYILFNPIK
jgi:REP element-mobilizing transposase RayT